MEGKARNEKALEEVIRMVKVRKVSKAGVTAKFAGGRFSVTHDGVTKIIRFEAPPRGDSDIMLALSAILDQYSWRAS